MGAVAAGGGRAGQAHRAAELADHDPPAAGAACRVRRRTSRSRRGRSCKLRERMNEILAQHTGKPVEQIAEDTERDYYMSGRRGARLRDRRSRGRSPPPAGVSRQGRHAPRGVDAKRAERTGGTREEARRQRQSLVLLLRQEPEGGPKLIAGPTVYICDECIELCNDIIAEEYGQEEAAPPDLAGARSRRRSRRPSTST